MTFLTNFMHISFQFQTKFKIKEYSYPQTSNIRSFVINFKLLSYNNISVSSLEVIVMTFNQYSGSGKFVEKLFIDTNWRHWRIVSSKLGSQKNLRVHPRFNRISGYFNTQKKHRQKKERK